MSHKYAFETSGYKKLKNVQKLLLQDNVNSNKNI